MIFNFKLTIDFYWLRDTRDGNNLWLRGLGDCPELLDVTLRPESVSEKRVQGWYLSGPECCLNKCPTWCPNCHVSKKQPQVPGHTMTDKQSLWHVCLLHLGTVIQAVSSWSHMALVTPGWITSIPDGERSSGISRHSLTFREDSGTTWNCKNLPSFFFFFSTFIFVDPSLSSLSTFANVTFWGQAYLTELHTWLSRLWTS